MYKRQGFPGLLAGLAAVADTGPASAPAGPFAAVMDSFAQTDTDCTHIQACMVMPCLSLL